MKNRPAFPVLKRIPPPPELVKKSCGRHVTGARWGEHSVRAAEAQGAARSESSPHQTWKAKQELHYFQNRSEGALIREGAGYEKTPAGWPGSVRFRWMADQRFENWKRRRAPG